MRIAPRKSQLPTKKATPKKGVVTLIWLIMVEITEAVQLPSGAEMSQKKSWSGFVTHGSGKAGDAVMLH